jgi:hypothetical protein
MDVGLSSWDQFDVLKPYDAYTLSSVTEMKTLNANVTFFVNVTVDGLAHAGDSLYEQVEEVWVPLLIAIGIIGCEAQ